MPSSRPRYYLDFYDPVVLGPQMKLVATAVTEINLKDSGHWLMEERPEETMKALIAFL
jgi:hypothetical protein